MVNSSNTGPVFLKQGKGLLLLILVGGGGGHNKFLLILC